MKSLVVGLLAYSVMGGAIIAAMTWGVLLVESGAHPPARQKVGVIALLLSIIQALMWMRLGAGLEG